MGKKLNPDAKPAEKLLTLYSLLLFKPQEWSLTELSKKLQCSKQTVMRLVEQLEASVYGKVLRIQRGREAVFCLDRPERPRVSLDAESLEILILCHEFVRHLLPDALQKNLDGTLRLAQAYTDEKGEEAEQFQLAGQAVYKGRIDYSAKQDIFKSIMRAIKNRKVCSLEYKSHPQKAARHFDFAPMRIISFHESIRVQGWLVTPEGPARPLHDGPLTLPLQRIERLELKPRSAAKLPEIPESQEVFGVMTDEIFTARILFKNEAAAYVAERQWSRKQTLTWNDDATLLLELETQSWRELLAWILSFDDSAEIISPDWLKLELTNKIKSLSSIYNIHSQ